MSISLETWALTKKYIDNLLSSGGGSTDNNYNLLANKPKINNVELIGNILSENLDLIKEITNEDINNLFL